MKRFSLVLMFVCAIGGIATTLPPAQAEPAQCGGKGQPHCPLEEWMEKHLQDPYEKKDLKAVAQSLEKVASFVPDPKWNEGEKGWAKIANDGAAAAKAGDFKTVQQSCKTCHKAWRSEYRKTHRMRPIGD